jgi:pyrimidine-nucleoside phosphorylase
MMNPVTVIARKRDGMALSGEEIKDFVAGFTSGEIPDYQMSALAMAIFFRGMNGEETAALTAAMLHSGTVLKWPPGTPPTVDKHSTGGLGDKVSLVLAPLLACQGMAVPMISGRGLGPTGGTLDKLEAIAGFRTNLSLTEMQDVTQRVGCVITGASQELAPADRKLYALRDVTGTVPSIPLITGSILSKKLAEGLRALVMDVKWGSGAFMKTLEEARALANSLVAVGKAMSLPVTALLTDMNQPLGRMCGNAVEVDESLAALQGEGPPDLTELTVRLGAELLRMTGLETDTQKAMQRLRGDLANGRALAKFEEMVAAQGGSLSAARPRAPEAIVHATQSGYLARIQTEALGWAVIHMGGGRKKLTDPIDHSVGLEMLKRLGDTVEVGEPLVRLFVHAAQRDDVKMAISNALTIQESPVTPPKLITELD